MLRVGDALTTPEFGVFFSSPWVFWPRTRSFLGNSSLAEKNSGASISLRTNSINSLAVLWVLIHTTRAPCNSNTDHGAQELSREEDGRRKATMKANNWLRVAFIFVKEKLVLMLTRTLWFSQTWTPHRQTQHYLHALKRINQSTLAAVWLHFWVLD